uniref:Uncharacterized protein n=1 Tax=Oryza punctata TaxID=4537 RepID=A0A0E0K4C8_ORYPU
MASTGHFHLGITKDFRFRNTANTASQPFSQFSPSISGGGNGYVAIHGYNVPGNPFVQLTGSNFSSASPTPRPTIQAPFLVAAPVPTHPHLVLPTHSPQFTQASAGQKSSAAVFVVLVLTWQVVLIMVIRCTWNHDVAPMDGAMIQEQRFARQFCLVTSYVSIGLRPLLQLEALDTALLILMTE